MKTPGDPRPPLFTPALAVDGVMLLRGHLLLVERGPGAFEGSWALPGGFVQVGETTEAAASREVREETGIAGRVVGLVGVYSDPRKRRDPRGHVVSVVYRLAPRARSRRGLPSPRGADDARAARWWPVERLPPLAFDHSAIVRDALARGQARRRSATPLSP